MQKKTKLPEVIDNYIQGLIGFDISRQQIIGFMKNNPYSYGLDIQEELDSTCEHDYCVDDIENYLENHLV